MKLYLEYLFHSICEHCNKAWSISDSQLIIGSQMYCPHCGHLNTISEIVSAVESPEGVKVKPPELTQPSTSADTP